jgi:YD repeat-containing protein
LTDANGNLYSFQYDSLGFLLKDSDPAGGVLSILIRPFFFVVP